MKPVDEQPVIGSRYIIDNHLYELIHKNEDLFTLANIHRNRNLHMASADFLHQLSRGNILKFASAPGSGSNAVAYLNPQDPAVVAAERKYAYVIGTQQRLGGRLPRVATKKAIAEIATEIKDPRPPSPESLYRWTRIFLAHNRDRFCLLKQRSHQPRGKQLHPDVHLVMTNLIESSYLTREAPSITRVFELIKGQIIHDNQNRQSYTPDFLTPPSLSTVRRAIERIPCQRRDRARLGSAAAKKIHDFSNLSKQPDYVLQWCEIDCHWIDLEIIDKAGKHLGKIAVLVVIFEKRTKMVIGWELSCTVPCAEKTLRALMMALRAVPGEECLRGKMEALASDNGSEFKNITLITFLDRLNIEYVIGPPKSPNARAVIERFFGTFESWAHEQRGASFPRASPIDDYDAVENAMFTIDFLRSCFVDWLEIYELQPHTALRMPPKVAWEIAMKGRLPPEKFSDEDLEILCRQVKTSRLAGNRAQFLGMTWTGPQLSQIRGRLKPGQKALCLLNPLDLGEIYVAHPDTPRELCRAAATNPRYQNGLTLSEHLALRAEAKLQETQFEASSDEAAVKLLKLRQKVSDEAQRVFRLKRTAPSKQGVAGSKMKGKGIAKTYAQPSSAGDEQSASTVDIKPFRTL